MARNLSETILEFASPLLGALPKDPGPERLHDALAIAMAAWNSITLDAWHNASTETEATRRSFESTPEPERAALLAIFDGLLERKRSHFADDRRAVGKWSVLGSPDGGFSLSAEGYLPDDPSHPAKA